jgi:peptidoglycan/LPS O-acetylase OafA/YrhL
MVETRAAGERLPFVDNLRILLIALVILVHLSVTYGGAGGWYYYERPTTDLAFAVLTFHNAVCQSFFMGFLFLISAYLTVGSYDRKGPKRYLRDRFLRLGVPLLAFEYVIHPLTLYPLIKADLIEAEGSFGEMLARYYSSFHLGSGPLWFVETLLIFALVYTLVRLVISPRPRPEAVRRDPPGTGSILAFALLLGVLTFIVRFEFPFGSNLESLNLQLCFFVQYIGMLIVGVIAYRHDWLRRLPKAAGRLWLGLAAVLIVLVFPALFVFGGAMSGNLAAFAGGWHWQAFAYALWEQLTGVAVIVGLTIFFRERFNQQGSIAREASAASYTTYIIHAPVLVLFALAVRNVSVYPLLKFALAAPVTVPLCFVLGSGIRRLPLARRIL